MKKSSSRPGKQSKTKQLEKIYRQYLTPMPIDEWNKVHSLKQPTILKQVPTKTSYSKGD